MPVLGAMAIPLPYGISTNPMATKDRHTRTPKPCTHPRHPPPAPTDEGDILRDDQIPLANFISTKALSHSRFSLGTSWPLPHPFRRRLSRLFPCRRRSHRRNSTALAHYREEDGDHADDGGGDEGVAHARCQGVSVDRREVADRAEEDRVHQPGRHGSRRHTCALLGWVGWDGRTGEWESPVRPTHIIALCVIHSV